MTTAGTHFIRIKEAAGESPDTGFRAQWALLRDGRLVSEADAFEPIAAVLDHVRQQAPEGSELMVLLPADRISVAYVELPKTQAAQLARAPAYAIEDHLIEPIEQLHVVAGKPVSMHNDVVRCAVMAINRAWLERLESLFTLHRLSPTLITSEASLMISDAGEIRLFIDGSQAVVRTEGVMTRLNNDSLAIFLGLLASQRASSVADGPHAALRHLAAYATPGTSQDVQQTLAAIAQEHHLAFDYHELTQSALCWLATGWMESLPRREAINLATVGGSARFADAFATLRRLAAAAIVGIMAQAGASSTAGLYFTWQASSLYGQAAATVRTELPNGAGDAEVQEAMAQYIDSHTLAGPGRGVVPFLNEVARAIATSGGALHVSYLHYRAEGTALDINVTTDSFDAFDRYRRSLSTAGIDATIDSLTKQGGAVKGTIHVRGS